MANPTKNCNEACASFGGCVGDGKYSTDAGAPVWFGMMDSGAEVAAIMAQVANGAYDCSITNDGSSYAFGASGYSFPHIFWTDSSWGSHKSCSYSRYTNAVFSCGYTSSSAYRRICRCANAMNWKTTGPQG